MSEQAPPPEPNLIEIRVGKLAQLFHGLDPYPFRKKDLEGRRGIHRQLGEGAASRQAVQDRRAYA
jgi:hypothetical protein